MGDLTVGIARNEAKNPFLSIGARHYNLSNMYKGAAEVVMLPSGQFTGAWAKAQKFDYLVRGVRGPRDVEDELALVHFNKENFYMETILLPCEEACRQISSTAIKAIIQNEGWERIIMDYVPDSVATLIKEKIERERP